MKKYFDSLISSSGRPISGASITVYTSGTASLASLFSTSSGTALTNPVTSNSSGYFEFYAADGRYDLTISSTGYGSQSVTDILLEDPADANSAVINGGTINGTTIGATTPSTGAFTTLSATGAVTLLGASVSTGNTFALQGATSAAGTGIAFPATQVPSSNPNTLDDYEEGTWTPTQGAGLTVVGTFSSSGTYTKIGRQVTISGNIAATTSIASSAASIFVGGLPFTNSTFRATGYANNFAISAGGSITVIESGTNVWSASSIAATPAIHFTATYFV